jgi:hypothetical protein
MTGGRVMGQSGRKVNTEQPWVPQTRHGQTRSGWRELWTGATDEPSAGAVTAMLTASVDIKALCRERKMYGESIISALFKFIGEIILA